MLFDFKRLSGLSNLNPELIRQFTKELLHTLISVVAIVVVVIWMMMCQGWSDTRWARWRKPGETHTVPLNDMILGHISYAHVRKGWICDTLINTSAVICVAGNILMARGWRARLVMLRRLAWIISILYLLRSITISVTTIPPPIIDCVPLLVDGAGSMLRALFGMISGERKECTDMVFSGHTIILLISFLFWTKYARHWSFVVYSAIHTVVGIASVLLVRYHYTLDVILAAVITSFVHHMYYRALDSAVRQRLAADRRIRCNAIFGKDAFAGPGKNTHGSDFAYNRVASEDNAEFVHSNTEPIDISSLRANFSAGIGLGLAQEQVYSTVLTLTSNTPAQNTMATLFEIPSGSDDIEKALGAALESENLHSAGLVYDEDIDTYHQDMLLINRPLSKCLSAAVAWMDGLHLR